MTKKSTDSEYQAPRTSRKWVGHPSNNSDIGYDPEWDTYIPTETTGPNKPIKEKEE